MTIIRTDFITELLSSNDNRYAHITALSQNYYRRMTIVTIVLSKNRYYDIQ